MEQMLDHFSNLGLAADGYHTKEEPFQKECKVVKFYRSKFHCVCFTSGSHYWAESDMTLYMSVA